MTSPDWANSIVHQSISRDMSFSRSSLITPIPRVTGTPNGRLYPPSCPATYAGWYSIRERARRHGVPGEPCALCHDQHHEQSRRPDVHQVSKLDGAVAELIDRDEVAGWVAIRTEHFRNLLLAEQLGCWLLFTWADGAIEIEEDYPPIRARAGTTRGDLHRPRPAHHLRSAMDPRGPHRRPLAALRSPPSSGPLHGNRGQATPRPPLTPARQPCSTPRVETRWRLHFVTEGRYAARISSVLSTEPEEEPCR